MCKILEGHSNIKTIFKIHPSQSKHNEEIIQTIKQNTKNPIIYLLNPVSKLIQSSDLVITITPEGWAPSTIILESMILDKPTMNIILDDKFFDFEYIKQNAVVTISDKSDLEKELLKILNDDEFRNELSNNSKKFTRKFLNNYGCASKKLAELLKEQ